ncbi:C2 family cysteine protease [Niabella aquatica]
MKQISLCAGALLALTLWYSCSKSDTTPEPAPKPEPPVTGGTVTRNWRDTSIADLMLLTYASTYSSKTPMGVRYQNLKAPTAADIEWLATAGNEPPVQASVANTHWQTFMVNLYPAPSANKPDPVHVNQHIIGDCSGLAAFACMAYAAPDFVKGLITDNGNNTYIVHMYDPQGKKIDVAVSSLFLAEPNGKLAACGAQGSNVATWATILEKAVMKYNYIFKLHNDGKDIGGIGSEFTTPMFTGNGNSFAVRPSAMNPANLQRITLWALANGKFVTGGWTRNDIVVGGKKSVFGHAYSLYVSTDATALFAMRNPWGFNPSTDGSGSTDNGVVAVPNVGNIVNEIDIRIIDPGAAGDKGNLTPYEKPKL